MSLNLVGFSELNHQFYMLKKILFLCLLASCFSSCVPHKDFIVTNELVESKMTKKKKPIKAYTYDTALSEEDKNYFAKKLDVNKEEILNEKLYNFVKSWEGTRYLWGGEGRDGIDCSALVQQLYAHVYKKKLPRTAQEMTLDKRLELFKSDQNLREGDFVFFRLNEERIITHVGIYLKNDKFFAANLVGGVEIASLKKPYWKKNFMAAGRFKR